MIPGGVPWRGPFLNAELFRRDRRSFPKKKSPAVLNRGAIRSNRPHAQGYFQ